MAQFRAGVIGLGIVSERIIGQFESQGDIAVVAVCDVATARVESYVKTHAGVAGFGDYKALLDVPDLDLVYVATPPAFHSDIVCAALNAGKHVLCEKPLANSLAEAEQMLAVARASGKVHALHFPLQYSAAVQEFEALYQSGFLGELRRVEVSSCTFQSGRGRGSKTPGSVVVIRVGTRWRSACISFNLCNACSVQLQTWSLR